MNMVGLLQELRQLGISLSVQGEQLKVAAAPGALTPALREQLLRHKSSLLQWLREQREAEDTQLPVCIPDPTNLYQPFPLTDLQLGFFMADDPYMEFHVRPHYYNEIDTADLDIDRYEQAWHKALLRHRAEIVVVTSDGRLQTVRELTPLRCQVLDLRDSTAAEVQAALLAVRADMMRSELPLDRWPWLDLRASLWRENGAVRARIHYNHNNFFSDGYGTTRLLQEVDRYYREPATVLPPLRLSYRDAVLALEELAVAAAGKAAQRYWEERLALLPEPPTLPLRTSQNRRCRSRLQRREGYLSAEAWRTFKARSAQVGVTPSNAIFALYAEVIGAWSNSGHFVLSNMMTRRLNIHPEIFDILGNFASLYPLEVDLRGDNSFAARARRMQEQVANDARRLQWGGMQVMQAWNRRKHTFGTAVLPFVIGSGLFMENFRKSDFGCLETSQVMLDHQFSELDDGRYWYVWDVLEEFFLPGVLDVMQQAYQALLERLIAEPDAWHCVSFELLPEAQAAARRQVMPPVQALPDLCLDDFLRRTASEQPQQIGLRVPGAAYDYRTLQAASTALAQRLRATAPDVCGRCVAIVAERGLALVQAVHAVLQSGGAYVPVDPELPIARQHYLITNSGAAAVLVQDQHRTALAGVGCPLLSIEESRCGSGEWDQPRLSQPDSLAYLIYTSGSTGQPKGVMIEHRGAVNTVVDINRRFGVTAADILFGVSAFGFDLSVYDLFGAAAAGATLVYPDPAQAFNPSHWLDVMLADKVSVWNSAPPLALLLVEVAETRGVLLPDLRLVMMSGDWIPVDLPARLKRIAPHARIVSLGGATEASIWSICYEIGELDTEWQSIPYGYPMTNQPWYVLDAWGRPAPDWTVGELYIGGIGLARGYWADPDKTAASFVTHPQTGERIYRTGDLGRYRPGGIIEFLGRRDAQVKIQGHRIELGEIEALLLASPEVGAAVAAVQGSEANQAQLLAYVVPAGPVLPDTDRLRQILQEKLPGYMVPRAIQVLTSLPLTGNGKVDRKALPEVMTQTAADAPQRAACRDPVDEIESRLLAIWRHVLNRPDLGVGDDFFDVGGQSFEAVRIVGAIRESFRQTLSLGLIWQQRTVERVAAALRDGKPAHVRSLLPLWIEARVGIPMYLVHPAGGHVMCYRGLAERLLCPVYGFQAPGVDGSEPPLADIAALAARYVAELDAHQPQGPFWLGGWSSGALIAFDMAAQLRTRGRQVLGIVMVDCPAPLLHAPIDEQTLLNWFLEDLDLGLPIAVQDDVPLDLGRQLTRIAELSAAQGRPLVFDLQQMAAIFRVFSGIVHASRRYHATPMEADVLLIRAEREGASEFAGHPEATSADWGWRYFCRRIVTDSLPGSHYTLLNDGSVQVLADRIDNWCRDTLARHEAESGKTL